MSWYKATHDGTSIYFPMIEDRKGVTPHKVGRAAHRNKLHVQTDEAIQPPPRLMRIERDVHLAGACIPLFIEAKL